MYYPIAQLGLTVVFAVSPCVNVSCLAIWKPYFCAFSCSAGLNSLWRHGCHRWLAQTTLLVCFVKKKIDKVILFFCFLFCVQGTPPPPLRVQSLSKSYFTILTRWHITLCLFVSCDTFFSSKVDWPGLVLPIHCLQWDTVLIHTTWHLPTISVCMWVYAKVNHQAQQIHERGQCSPRCWQRQRQGSLWAYKDVGVGRESSEIWKSEAVLCSRFSIYWASSVECVPVIYIPGQS